MFGPCSDVTQHIATTATYIDNVQWFRWPLDLHQMIQEMQRWPIRQRETVYLREIDEALAKVFISARFVHPLRQIFRRAAIGEVDG